MKERNRLERLTEREKACLRLWLRHKTAKEIALDLGISHHAVEKRLKMARTKLDVATSLEAARLLGEVEGYQQPVAQAPDLAEATVRPQSWLTRKRTMGVAVMTSIATIALIFIMQGGTQFPQARETTGPRDVATPQDRQFIEATPERAEAYVRNEFEVWDRDYSQFIELEEAPSQVTGPYNGPLEGDEARRSFVSTIDADGDGKVSFDEFAAKMMPNVLEQGIPLIPADEVQVSFIRGERDDSQLDSYLGRGRVTPTPVEMRLILAASFARIDADGSGYLEGRETPVTEPPGPVPVLDMDEEGKLFETGETITRTDGELRDNFYRDADTDGDGRISRDEYDKWAIEQTHRSGINPESRQAMNAPLDPQS